jgi:hypothetical protein
MVVKKPALFKRLDATRRRGNQFLLCLSNPNIGAKRGQAELKSDSPKFFPGAAAFSAGGILSD